MEIERAKKIIKDINTSDDYELQEAYDTVFQELDRLQKENEELKKENKIILSDEEYRKAIDYAQKDCISKDKIREKIEECEKFIIDDENFSPLHKNDKELLEELLKEE